MSSKKKEVKKKVEPPKPKEVNVAKENLTAGSVAPARIGR